MKKKLVILGKFFLGSYNKKRQQCLEWNESWLAVSIEQLINNFALRWKKKKGLFLQQEECHPREIPEPEEAL